MGEGFTAKPAKRQYDQLAACNPAMRRFKFSDGCRRQHLQRCLRQMRIAARDVEGITSPLNQLHAKRKAFFADIIAHDVEGGLIVRITDPALHGVLQRRHVARQMHRAGVDQCIKIAALPAQIIGQGWCVAQDITHQLQQAGPGLQQAEDVDRTWHRFNHIVEAGNGTVGIRRLCQRRHDGGQDRLKRIARRCAADCADLATAPAGQSLHHGRGVGIAQIGQLLLKRQAFVRHARPIAAACIDHAVIDCRNLRGDRLNRSNQRIGIVQAM